jgi:hypothetical protein
MSRAEVSRCHWCRKLKASDGTCDCWPVRPLPPRRLVCDTLDLETVDEDGPPHADETCWLDEEELPF